MKVELTWGFISVLDVNELRIYRSDDPSFTPDESSLIATLPSTASSYEDVNPLVPSNGLLFYKVVAVRGVDDLVTRSIEVEVTVDDNVILLVSS